MTSAPQLGWKTIRCGMEEMSGLKGAGGGNRGICPVTTSSVTSSLTFISDVSAPQCHISKFQHSASPLISQPHIKKWSQSGNYGVVGDFFFFCRVVSSDETNPQSSLTVELLFTHSSLAAQIPHSSLINA